MQSQQQPGDLTLFPLTLLLESVAIVEDPSPAVDHDGSRAGFGIRRQIFGLKPLLIRVHLLPRTSNILRGNRLDIRPAFCSVRNSASILTPSGKPECLPAVSNSSREIWGLAKLSRVLLRPPGLVAVACWAVDPLVRL